METSEQGNLLGKGKLSGKNFWTRVKLLGKGKLFGKNFWHGEYFWTWGQGKPSWQVVSFLENGNFLTRKLSGKNFWTWGNFWTRGQGKPSWQAVSFLENGNIWTRKPSWQEETFWKELVDKGKTLNEEKASGQGGYFLVKKDKTFFIGEYLVLTQNGLLNKWGNL